ncbi:alpha/beta hydrolase [Sedimenticola hydrogenitrophicus]|uniref:alpha/beta hydrolase n=1 Tax=Sedimenticola hydrogenitrophicus TaxID=2967975 RepID=UPI0021A3AD01|nr:alpha/beta fold hydrolase [Sedimenticola hydrogenitrophicus]
MTHAKEHRRRPWWKRWPLWLTASAAVLLLSVAAIELTDKPVGAMPVERNAPQAVGLAYREVAIPTEGGKHLFGWFIPAEGTEPAPTVAVLHGWGGNAGMLLPLAPLLHRAGYAVLLFDARNHGNSDSDGSSTLPSFAEDLEHALDWLALQPDVDAARLAALGHSLGAAAALLVASRRDLAAVVSISAFADPQSNIRRILAAYHIPYFPIGTVFRYYKQHTMGQRISDIAPRNAIRKIHYPVLLVHGSEDETVPIADAKTIYAERPGENVRLVILAGGHDLTQQAERYAGELIDFLDQATGRGRGAQSGSSDR